MNKKNILNLSVMGAMGIASASVANAQSKTFYQCFPISCKAGQYNNGSKCITCNSDEWCPDGKEKSTGAQTKIINKYKDTLYNTCKGYADKIFNDFVNKGGYGERRELTKPIRNLAVNITYSGQMSKTEGGYSHSAGSDTFRINCVDNVPDFATSGISDINSKIASGSLLKNVGKKNLSNFTDSDTMSEIKKIREFEIGYGDEKPLSSGYMNLQPGLYAVNVEGAGGGGGAGGGYNDSARRDGTMKGGDGGWGQSKIGEFLIIKPMYYTVSIGDGGSEGVHDHGSGGNGGLSSFKIDGIVTVKAEGGNGGVGANEVDGNSRGSATAKSGVYSTGCQKNNGEPRMPGCGRTGSHNGYSGGKGRVRIYKLDIGLSDYNNKMDSPSYAK